MLDPLELLGEDVGAHAAIVLTYELHLPLYDGWVRRRLAQAGAETQLVFCDLGPYQRELPALPTARHCGRRYSVTPVAQPGAFHPKVYLLLGRTKGRLLVGSGNATVGGLLRNAELFGAFHFDGDTMAGPHPAFGKAVALADQLAQGASGVAQQQLAYAVSRAPWLAAPAVPDHREFFVTGPGRTPLLEQLRVLLGEARPSAVLVVSASFDRTLAALAALAALVEGGGVRCVLQPEHARLDGAAVQRLGKNVAWFPFVDPYPPEKKKRRDVRLHAKLLVFTCGERELVVYGSANASRPALLAAENTEVVVAAWYPAGTAEAALGLGPSLAAPPVHTALAQKVWEDDDLTERPALPCVLVGAVPEARGLALTLSQGPLPRDARVQLGEAATRPLGEALALDATDRGALAPGATVPVAARVAWLIDATAVPLSNPVGLTWPALLERRGASGLSRRTEAALNAMQDGVLLGTVLFELLNNARDFEVARGSAGAGRPRAEDAEVPAPPAARATASYYTDATPVPGAAGAPLGDRADLDLLAALVQPLARGRTVDPLEDADEEEDNDDALLAEENARTALGHSSGAAGTAEAETPGLATRANLERAARRLVARLERAATAAERAAKESYTRAGVISPQELSRQIWMAHLGAFLCGRAQVTKEGDEVACLAPREFAAYVVRLSRALAGGRHGGLLRALPPAAWTGPDGETLCRGLSFLWTCLVWAVNFLERDSAARPPTSLTESALRLVGARLTAALEPRCERPDFEALRRRLPASDGLPVEALAQGYALLSRLARHITALETATPPAAPSPRVAVVAGDLVLHAQLGVTVLVRVERGEKHHLLDLAEKKNLVAIFVSAVAPVTSADWRRPEQALLQALYQDRSAGAGAQRPPKLRRKT